MSIELRKCPICKKERGKLIYSMGLVYICCPSKSQKHIVEVGPFKTEKKAIEMWNGEKTNEIK